MLKRFKITYKLTCYVEADDERDALEKHERGESCPEMGMTEAVEVDEGGNEV